MQRICLSTKPIIVISNVQVCCCLFLMLLIWEVGSESTLYRVFLNSYGFCGNHISFQVKPDQGYIVRADVSPNTDTTSFRDCETSFYSKEDNGRLCVIQDGKMSEIDDINAELLVYDGYQTDGSPMIFSLNQFHGRWAHREHCTKSRYVNLYMRIRNKSLSVDIRKVYINLKVLDIESRDRRLYLDEIYCNRSYQLQNSLVSVYNRAYQRSDVPPKNSTNTCSLKIEKVKNYKSICFVYAPSGQIACSNPWIISITSESQNLFYKLKCEDEQARQLHAWCGNNRTYSLTVNFQRADQYSLWNSSLEVPEMFRLIFADHKGSPDSLLEKVKRELLISENDSGLDIGWIVCIVLACILLLTTIAFVYWKRSLLPCVRYKAVHNPGNSVSV